MTIPLLRNVFQIAYVTNDIERAAAIMQDQFGTGAVKIMREIPGAVTDIGLCFAGETNYELLQPLNPSGDMYSDWIAGADHFVLRFHHLGIRVDSNAEMDCLRKAHRDAGHNFTLDNVVPGFIDVFYADTRDQLGHYLEYFCLGEGAKAMFADVEGTTIR